MEPNNPNLGHEADAENAAPETEHTTADAQDSLEQTVETTSSEAEPMTAEAPAENAAATSAQAPIAEERPEESNTSPMADEEAQDAPQEAAAETSTTEAPAETETPTPEEPEPEPEPRIKRGDIVTGTVTATSPTEVLVDLGEGVTGVIASRELELMDRTALEALQVGKDVTAYVLKVKGDGQPVLSLARAEEERNWRMAQEYYENKKVYFGKVAGYNKGGLIVRFGKVRGFVPASQISRERQQRAVGDSPEARWGHMVGEDIAVKVVEIDRSRNRLILSERAATREWREFQKAKLLRELKVGEVRRGKVISLADFGAFVDLGGADGLVHLTEISWQHVTHPREVLQVGQEVEVEVVSIDPERNRIGLSMKRREEDPWRKVVERYRVGQLVQATVTKLTKFGAFACLIDAPEVEGLIHISELADYRVSHPREVVLVGDVLTLRIIKIDAERRRLGLSLRQVDSPKYLDQDWQFISDDLSEKDNVPSEEAKPADSAPTPSEESADDTSETPDAPDEASDA